MRKSGLILLTILLFIPQWGHSGIHTKIKDQLNSLLHFGKLQSSKSSSSPTWREQLFRCRAQVGEQLNFGLVLYNHHYKIYRTSKLNAKNWPDYQKFLLENHLEYPTKSIYLNSSGAHISTNLSSGQTLDQFHDEKNDHQPSLFFPFEFTDPKDNPLRTGGKGGRETLFQILHEILTTDSQAMSIHCEDGVHRTALAALMIRYLQGGFWTAPQSAPIPAAEVKRSHRKIRGTVSLHNQAEIDYYHFNQNDFRKENLEAVETLSHDLRFSCLRDQFSALLNTPSTLPPSSPLKSCENTYSYPSQFDRVLSPLEKTQLWDSCNYLKRETELASQIDNLEGLLKKHKKTTHQDVFDMTQYFISIPEATKKWGKTFSSEPPHHQKGMKDAQVKLKARFCKIVQEPLNFPGAHHQALLTAHENANRYCQGIDSFDD